MKTNSMNECLRLSKTLTLALLMAAFAACSSDDGGDEPSPLPDDPTPTPIEPSYDVSIDVPDGGFKATRCQAITIKPTVAKGKSFSFTWSINGVEVAQSDTLDVVWPNEGTCNVTLRAVNAEQKDTTINVAISVGKESNAYSPYITSVPDFLPAPGQFVNSLPEYADGDTQSDMNKKALEAIGNNNKGMVSLGGYGGYVVCGFDHTIANVPGEYDFKVLGNAFYAKDNPNPDASKNGGSCEPGIVMVAYDRNKNGVADADEWYEIAGSEYSKPTTIKNYEITYQRPAADHVAVKGEESWNSDAEYIPWEDNQGNTGYVFKNIYHRQDYYPKWISDDVLTFSGTLLPNNAVDESGNGTYWVLYFYDWGYADNYPNEEEKSNIDIDWAVDADGNKVHLPGIDFVKIYTGVNQYCGWLGETSTEVMGVNDLHLLK